MWDEIRRRAVSTELTLYGHSARRRACPPESSWGEHDIIQRGHLLLGKGGGVVEAGQNVLAGDRRIRAKQSLDTVSVREHPNDLVNRNARAPDAGLAVTDFRVNRDSIIHGTSFQGIP